MADIFIEIYEKGWVGDSQASRINFHLNFLEKGKEGRFYA